MLKLIDLEIDIYKEIIYDVTFWFQALNLKYFNFKIYQLYLMFVTLIG